MCTLHEEENRSIGRPFRTKVLSPDLHDEKGRECRVLLHSTITMRGAMSSKELWHADAILQWNEQGIGLRNDRSGQRKGRDPYPQKTAVAWCS